MSATYRARVASSRSTFRRKPDVSEVVLHAGLPPYGNVQTPAQEIGNLRDDPLDIRMTNSRSTCAAIQSASTEDQVVGAVRDYLASLSAAEVALMPAGLTTLGRSHAANVVESALELVHREMVEVRGAAEMELIRDAVLVLATAATRLAALAVSA